MKILFTNVKALASDYAFQILRKEADVEIVEHVGPMSEDELIKMIEEIDAMVVDGRTYITEKAIESGRKLRIIARAGVGLDNSDVKATKKGNLRYMCMHARARAKGSTVLSLLKSRPAKYGDVFKDHVFSNYKGNQVNEGIIISLNAKNISDETKKIKIEDNVFIGIFRPVGGG